MTFREVYLIGIGMILGNAMMLGWIMFIHHQITAQ